MYLVDSLGGLAGGLAVSLILLDRLDHFGLLYGPAMLNLAAAAAVAWRLRRRVLAGLAATAATAIVALAAGLDLDAISTAREYAGQDVVFRGSSPYGRLVVTRGSAVQLPRERPAALLHRRRDAARGDGPLRHGPAPRRPPRAAALRRGLGHGPGSAQVPARGHRLRGARSLDPPRGRPVGSRSPGRSADPRHPERRPVVRLPDARAIRRDDRRSARPGDLPAQPFLHGGILARQPASSGRRACSVLPWAPTTITSAPSSAG